MDKIGKIVVQEKTYELAWNGGVIVQSPYSMSRNGFNTIRILTDVDVWVGNEKVEPKPYVKEVIGRAVKEFLYQDITPFALASSNSRFQVDTRLIDTYNNIIVSPDKGLNAPRFVDSVFSFEDESNSFPCPHCYNKIQKDISFNSGKGKMIDSCPHCNGELEWRLALGKPYKEEVEE